jgi:hypothetical protein
MNVRRKVANKAPSFNCGQLSKVLLTKKNYLKDTSLRKIIWITKFFSGCSKRANSLISFCKHFVTNGLNNFCNSSDQRLLIWIKNAAREATECRFESCR